MKRRRDMFWTIWTESLHYFIDTCHAKTSVESFTEAQLSPECVCMVFEGEYVQMGCSCAYSKIHEKVSPASSWISWSSLSLWTKKERKRRGLFRISLRILWEPNNQSMHTHTPGESKLLSPLHSIASLLNPFYMRIPMNTVNTRYVYYVIAIVRLCNWISLNACVQSV